MSRRVTDVPTVASGPAIKPLDLPDQPAVQKIIIEPASIEHLKETPGRAAELLKAELARAQLRLIDAQIFVQNALQKSPLRETSAEIEESVLAMLRKVARNDPVSDQQLDSAIRTAQHYAGARGLAQLVAVFEAQVSALAAELVSSPGFRDRANAVLDRLAIAALQTISKAPPPDRHAALESMNAACDALSCGFSADAIYTSSVDTYLSANSFTNEPGFPLVTARVDAKGGASIGVGGVIFDLGSLGSDLIISVDANPKIRDTVQVFTAILLAVDVLVEKNGWDDDRRAKEVLERLSRGANAETRAELEALGISGRLREHLDENLEAIKRKLDGTSFEFAPVPQDLWCRGALATKRIAHLTRLALEGRIVALTADLADPRAVARMNALLEASGTTAKVIHFSNALDYVANVRGMVRAFGALTMHPQAVLTSSAYFVRDAGKKAGGDAQQLTEALGTIEAPAINRAHDWLGEGKKGDRLHDILWADDFHPRHLFGYLTRHHGAPWDLVSTPASFEQYQGATERIVAWIFEDAGRARGQLTGHLKETGRWQAYERVLGDEALAALELPVPKNPANVVEIANTFDLSFWTDDLKISFLKRAVGEPDFDPALARACRTYEDLRELELTIRMSAA